MLAITEPDAWVLRYAAILNDWPVLDVVWVGIIRNLVVVPAQRSHEPELVRRIDVENQGAEAPVPILGIVDYLRNRWLQTQIASIPVHTGVVCKTLGVTPKAHLRIGLVKASPAENYFRFIVAFETGAGDEVEHAIGPVSKLCAITSTIYFHVVEVFGVELRAEIGCNIGVRHRHTID